MTRSRYQENHEEQMNIVLSFILCGAPISRCWKKKRNWHIYPLRTIPMVPQCGALPRDMERWR